MLQWIGSLVQEMTCCLLHAKSLCMTQSWLLSHPGGWLYVFVPVRTPAPAPPPPAPPPAADSCPRDNFWTTFGISFIFGTIVGPDLQINWLDFGRFSSWPWPWIFNVKYRIGYISAKNDPIATKRHSDWTLGFKWNHRVWPWPWPWPWIFKVKYWIGYISAKNGSIATKQKANTATEL